MIQRNWRIPPFPLHLIVLLAVGSVALGLAHFTHIGRAVFVDIGSPGERYSLDGFYAAEGEAGFTYRWTGPSARLVLPNRGIEPWDITLAADAPRPEGAEPPHVSMYANDRLLGDFVAEAGIRDYRFTYTPVPLRADLVLTLQSDTFSPAGDPRRLGLLVNSIAVQPAGPVSPWQALPRDLLLGAPGLALSGVVYWLLRMTLISPMPSLAAALAIQLTLATGIAADTVPSGVVALHTLVLFAFSSILTILYRYRGNRSVARWTSDRAAWLGRRLGGFLSPRTPAALAAWAFAHRLDLFLCVALFGAAVLVRLPHYLEMPHITDEFREVQIATEVARGERYPLFFSINDYMGVVHTYLLGLFLRLAGITLNTPRLYAVLMGALTAPLTFWFVRELRPRRVALLAGALMLTSPMHILMNSHLALENAITPVFALVMLSAFTRGLAADSGVWIAASGLFAGLTLQTHPLVAVIFPAMAAVYLVVEARRGRSLVDALRRGRLWAALGLFLVGYGNLIVHNVAGLLLSGRLFMMDTAQKRTAAQSAGLDPFTYLRTLAWLVQNLLSSLSGLFVERFDPAALARPSMAVYAAWLAAGAVNHLRRRRYLGPVLLVVPVALLPLLNGRYEVPADTRYLAFLLPICYLLMADVAFTLWDSFGRAVRGRVAAAAVIAAVVLVAYPLWPLFEFYRANGDGDWSGRSVLETTVTLRQARDSAFPVLIDAELNRVGLPYPGSNILKALEYSLYLDGTPCRVFSLDPLEKPPRTFNHEVEHLPVEELPAPALLVLTPISAGRVAARHPLSLQADGPRDARFGLYSLGVPLPAR